MEKQLKFYGHFDLETKAVEGEDGLVITGYANTVSKDRHGDVIPADAWSEMALANYRKNPIILAYHNHSMPVGKATEVAPDQNGLKITAKISAAAKDVYSLIKDGILKCFSVGFVVKDAVYDNVSDVLTIKQLELLEVSVVSVPANQDSVFDLAKAFNSAEEFTEFKKSFIKIDPLASSEADENKDSSESSITSEEKELDMDKEQLEALIKSATEAAVEKAVASVKVEKSGAERLLEDVEKRLQDETTTVTKAVDDLRAELNEKAAEIKALREQKAIFEEKRVRDAVSYGEKEEAVLMSKIKRIGLEETKSFQNLVQKYGDHVPSADWENVVSTNMMDEIRRALVIAPLFRSITMPGVITKFPVNPEAGYATWVQAGEFKAATSSGAAAEHILKEVVIQAHKLATKEFIGNEEEYDAILALLPIIRDAMVRRTAKSIDKGLLLGAGAGADPIKGITKYEASGNNTTLSIGGNDKLTVADLRALRRNLGVWGLDPAAMRFVVSTDGYYNLLDDAEFQTMDKVGAAATIVTGQIGSVGGTPVIVSGELGAQAEGGYPAIAINAANFMVGNYKGLSVESDYQVEYQQTLLVASLRMGFQQISTVDGQAVSCARWIA